MFQSKDFRFIMISAGFEHGGNVTLRLFDGHPELYVYPFESQLGNSLLSDYLSSIFHFKYRYPEFPSTGTPEDDFELFFDEEMKVRVRTPKVSKFKDAEIRLNDADRKRRFVELMKGMPRERANIVAAFFIATFDAWTNLKKSGREHVYVGYSPAIGIDGDRILADFPGGHVVHIVRNPYSAYSETRQRPFPQSLQRYVISYNFLHHMALIFANRYPDRFHILHYEDILRDPKGQFTGLCKKIGIPFSDTFLYPSWNGEKLVEAYPWGTIKSATLEEDETIRRRLTQKEREEIASLSSVMLKLLGYDQLKF
jgi:Sulfotransferase family